MTVSTVIDTIIGLSFTFFLLALASSAIGEWVATVTQKRAKYLLRALSEMLDGADQQDKAKGLQQRLGTIWQSVRDEQALHDRANDSSAAHRHRIRRSCWTASSKTP